MQCTRGCCRHNTAYYITGNVLQVAHYFFNIKKPPIEWHAVHTQGPRELLHFHTSITTGMNCVVQLISYDASLSKRTFFQYHYSLAGPP